VAKATHPASGRSIVAAVGTPTAPRAYQAALDTLARQAVTAAWPVPSRFGLGVTTSQ
jgi:hypothetical protein